MLPITRATDAAGNHQPMSLRPNDGGDSFKAVHPQPIDFASQNPCARGKRLQLRSRSARAVPHNVIFS